jgi:hypothetical protein
VSRAAFFSILDDPRSTATKVKLPKVDRHSADSPGVSLQRLEVLKPLVQAILGATSREIAQCLDPRMNIAFAG